MKEPRTADVRRVLARVAKDRIRFVQLWFADVLGFLKGVTVPAVELPRVFEDGMNFDGSSVEGFARIEESDMTIRPDVATFALLPWEIQGERAARMFCDVVTPAGKPFAADPRSVLRRVLARAARLGFSCKVGAEMEFFFFRSPDSTEPLDRSGYFDLTPAHAAETVRHEIIDALEQLSIRVEYSHHEVSESQHEIDLRYDEALRCADNIITTRFVARQIAQPHNVHVTFMPKPVFGVNGSGMHLHISLFRKDANAFYAADGPMHLSETARRFIAGLLHHAPELTAVTNQWVNSYKRLVPGYEAPVYVSWAQMNRSALCRVPAFEARRRTAARVEYRATDAACNPYLAIAVLLAAGLDGIERRLKLGPPTSDNIFRMTDEERAAAGITCLPKDLSDAIRLAEAGTFVRSVLGDELFGYFIRNKRMEWDEYKAQVTEFELKRYLPIL
uniref:Glutamine synthetase n=1 Tax=candidate division WOR-3 bacterium TaxID=2052148 RepID=A0A7C4GHY4_UNCW3